MESDSTPVSIEARDLSIMRQVALKAAVDTNGVSANDAVILDAEVFYAWLTNPFSLKQVIQAVQQPVQASNGQALPQPTNPSARPVDAQSTTEELWGDLIRDAGEGFRDWYNNIGQEGTSLVGGNRPDFKHKRITKRNPKDGKDWPLSLFLKGSYGDAPEWVFNELGKIGLLAEASGEPF